MFDVPLDDPLSDHELALVIEMRDRERDQRRIRTQLLTDLGARVEVHCRLHLVEPEIEGALVSTLRDVDDRLAVLRHADSDARDRLADLHEKTLRERVALAAQLDAHVIEVSAAIGLPPRGGADWSLTDVPSGAIDNVVVAWAAMRRELVRLVDLLVDSALVRPAGTSDGLVDIVLREYDRESVARVQAFAREIGRVENLAELCAERVRRMALRAAHAHPRGWLAQSRSRSLQAREALDMVRAVQAARAELEIISR